MTTTNQHTEIRTLTSRVQELEESLRAEMRENVRLKLKIEELDRRTLDEIESFFKGGK